MRHIPVLLAAAVLSAAPAFAAGPVSVTDLQVEHAAHPVGIGVTSPRFSWKIISDHAGAKQTAYEIIASPKTYGPVTVLPAPLWSSGKVASDQSVLIPWGGKPLDSRADVQWKVRIWDETGTPTDWSTPASFELGILDPAKEWKGQWITAELPRVDMMAEPLAKTDWISGGAAANQSTGIRKIIDIPEGAKILSATCDANADGLINLFVNGNAIKQGPSSHTAPFHADFITDLKPGKNTIGLFSLAVRRPTPQDKRNAIAAHLNIELADGQHIEVVTDGDWKAGVAPEGDWYAPDYDDASWKPASDLGPYDASKVAPSADSTLGPGRYMRRAFSVTKPIAKARLYYTALGTCEPAINGKRINDHLLDPGWTEYSKRTMVREQDVTNLLTQGQNAVGVVLADGWFAGRVGWAGLAQYSQISRRPLFNAQLEITYTDGSTDTIATDASWKFGDGQIVGSDQQLGEIIDDRKPGLECTAPAFDDSQWKPAVVDSNINVPLSPSVGPPVTVFTELKPAKIARFGDTFVVDFGQNMVGHVRITANGKPGTEITVSHGEMLQPDGTIYNENLRQAISIDKFILKGGGSETLEPQFTFHGFRYAQITGYPGDLNPDDIKAVVISSDCPTTGTFECSNPEVNRLYENTVWGMRSNYISIPTDCPQRDERMGWMGDAQVFAPTAARHADVSGFFMKWMQDVDDGQNANGSFNNVNPRARENQSYPVWADAGVVIPWTMYTTYGDPAFLSINYPNMQRYVDYEERTYTNLMPTGGVGDHLAPMGQRGGGPGRGGRQGAALPLSDGTYFAAAPAAGTPPARGAGRGFGRGGFGGGRGFGGPSVTTIVDTAYFARCAWIVSQSAAILGKPDDAQKYDDLYHRICDTFTKNFVQPDGSMPAGSQTTYCLALEFNLVPDAMRPALMKHLTDDIDQRQHLSTGFVGVGFINLVLGQHDRSDEAYKLLLTDTYPSWLYEVKNGATTMWERWDGWTDTGGFQASSMNSFNHYSFGGVGRWMYEGMEGITLDESHPGYKQFLLQPEFSSSMSYVKGSIDSPYGKIVSNWKIDGDNLIYDVTVPPNSSALMTLPLAAKDLKSSGDPTGKIVEKDGSLTVPLAAGTYQFTMPKSVAK
ncbi:MAG TPA: family 78 glycoside hydrolase catalytic domain [Phycisphaerae bacterium]|nr:family 78 glycoside hydrolase catalytic domain [Phycisphaerae bacterium]